MGTTVGGARTIPEENKVVWGPPAEEDSGSFCATYAPQVRGVKVHDDYKYVSKQYEIHRFIFMSIEPWLNGRCLSKSYPDTVRSNFVLRGGKSLRRRSGPCHQAIH